MSLTRVLVIGDPHFKAKRAAQGKEFIVRCLEYAQTHRPDLIVILGDVLDTHEVARVGPFNQACDLVQKLSKVAHTALIIGNHDLMNNSQFLTSNHFFNPLKKWEDVTVVDSPTRMQIGDQTFVCVPYVPPGRFSQALDQVDGWELADCIFAHQEFQGCRMGSIKSTAGDVWNPNLPPVISGHIHDEQTLGNVYYPGSSLQHTFAENPDKYIWLCQFGSETWSHSKLRLEMSKSRKTFHLRAGELSQFDETILDRYFVKLVIEGRPEEFSALRQSTEFEYLSGLGVNFSFKSIVDEEKAGESLASTRREQVNYAAVLSELVQVHGDKSVEVYRELFGELQPLPAPEKSSPQNREETEEKELDIEAVDSLLHLESRAPPEDDRDSSADKSQGEITTDSEEDLWSEDEESEDEESEEESEEEE